MAEISTDRGSRSASQQAADGTLVPQHEPDEANHEAGTVTVYQAQPGTLDTARLLATRDAAVSTDLNHHENGAFYENNAGDRDPEPGQPDLPTTEGLAEMTLAPSALAFSVDHFSDEGELTRGVSSTNLLQDQYEEPEIIIHSVPSGHSGAEEGSPTCAICLGWEDVERRPCCSAYACSSCARFHVTTQISMGILAIECLSCDTILQEAEVLASLDPAMTRTYKLLRRMRAQALRKGTAKVDGSDDTDVGSGDEEHGIHCLSSDDETGSDAESGNMAAWAEEEDQVTGLANARRCPQCQIYIQKRAGCYNIKCPLCGIKFCYKCGERLPHDMSLHRNRNLTVHRPWVRCHGCGLCCSKFCSGLRDCCCSRRWLQVVRLAACFLLLALLAFLVLHFSGIVL